MSMTNEEKALENLLNFLQDLSIKAANADYMPRVFGHSYLDDYLNRMDEEIK